MAEDKKMIKVRNRNAGGTGYFFETNGGGQGRRYFEPNEEKIISLDELKQLSYTRGGEYILKNCLVINDKSALEALDLEVEPEYFYDEAAVKEILISGSYDLLEDTLNFAPAGVIDMIKKFAVELEIPDVNKRKMISEKTGLNIDNAIRVNQIMAEESTEEEKSEAPKRKTTPVEVKSDAPQRKTTPSDKYKVVTTPKTEE